MGITTKFAVSATRLLVCIPSICPVHKFYVRGLNGDYNAGNSHDRSLQAICSEYLLLTDTFIHLQSISIFQLLKFGTLFNSRRCASMRVSAAFFFSIKSISIQNIKNNHAISRQIVEGTHAKNFYHY